MVLRACRHRGSAGEDAGGVMGAPIEEVGPALASGPPRTDRIRIWSAFALLVDREESPEAPWRGPGIREKGPVPSVPSRIIVTPRPASRSWNTATRVRQQPPNGGRARGNRGAPLRRGGPRSTRFSTSGRFDETPLVCGSLRGGRPSGRPPSSQRACGRSSRASRRLRRRGGRRAVPRPWRGRGPPTRLRRASASPRAARARAPPPSGRC